MARHKDYDWDLHEGTPNARGGKTHEWPSIHAALLMDIRDELKQLNALLHCHNFTGIPDAALHSPETAGTEEAFETRRQA